MENSLSLYFIYKIDLKKENVEILTYAFTKDGNIIKNKNVNFPDLKDIQTINEDLKIPYNENQDKVLFAKLIKENIPITTNLEEINHIVLGFIDSILDELNNKYVIERKYQTKFTNQSKIALTKIDNGINIKVEEETFNMILTAFEDSYYMSINVLLNQEKDIKPSQIINNIKRKVLGQDEAINTIVTNVLLNQKLIDLNNPDILKTGKTNILVSGPTGVGKTEIVTLLAKQLNLPIELASTTNYSTVGYKGDDLSTILVNLLRKANGNLELAKRGIICFDEIDKLGDSDLEIRKGLAQELLTWISGTKIPVVYDRKQYIFDTSYLTFIGLGAFTKMREQKRTNQIGFSSPTEVKESFETEDYISFGMSRELMGRMNVITNLNSLEIIDLENILINSDISPLKTLINIIETYDVSVTYSDDLIHRIATEAIKHKIGARALAREVNKIKNKILYPIMEGKIKSIHLTEDMLDDNYTFQNDNQRKLKMSE